MGDSSGMLRQRALTDADSLNEMSPVKSSRDAHPIDIFRSIQAGETLLPSAPLMSELAGLLEEDGFLLESILAHERARFLDARDVEVAERARRAQAELRTSLEFELRFHAVDALRGFGGEPGKVLHVVPRGLPFEDTVETRDAHQQALSQQSDGLTVGVVSLLPHPWDLLPGRVDLEIDLDGVTYFFLLPEIPMPAPADELLVLNIRMTGFVMQRFRPSALHVSADLRSQQLGSLLGAAGGLTVHFAKELTTA